MRLRRRLLWNPFALLRLPQLILGDWGTTCPKGQIDLSTHSSVYPLNHNTKINCNWNSNIWHIPPGVLHLGFWVIGYFIIVFFLWLYWNVPKHVCCVWVGTKSIQSVMLLCWLWVHGVSTGSHPSTPAAQSSRTTFLPPCHNFIFESRCRWLFCWLCLRFNVWFWHLSNQLDFWLRGWWALLIWH